MQILVDARVGWGAGIGRYVSNVVPNLAALRPDIRFDVLVPEAQLIDARASLETRANVCVLPCDIEPFSVREQWALARRARTYDLTWFTNYWVPLNWSGRYIAVVHDLLHLHEEFFPAPRVKRTLSRAAFRKIGKGAEGLIYISRFTQREFEARFGPARRSRVAHNGMDHLGWEPFDPESPPQKKSRLLVVGASKRHKNFEVILEAWARTRASDRWTLTVISPDVRLRSSIDLDAFAARGRATDIRRGVSNEDLRTIYSETAIMLMPSLYEGFGLPLLEGMQAGAYCVSSTAEALVEISDGAFVRFVNGHDLEGWVRAIEASCAMMDNREFDFGPLQQHNMRHALSYTWRRTAEATASLLDEVLSVSPERR